jgi:hypothetical protein
MGKDIISTHLTTYQQNRKFLNRYLQNAENFFMTTDLVRRLHLLVVVPEKVLEVILLSLINLTFLLVCLHDFTDMKNADCVGIPIEYSEF